MTGMTLRMILLQIWWVQLPYPILLEELIPIITGTPSCSVWRTTHQTIPLRVYQRIG